MSSQYIVRQPIRDGEDRIIGYEMVYHGENQAFSSEGDTARQYALADAVCSVLNKTSVKALRGATNFMTFNTILLMKRVPLLFEPDNVVIQIDDSVVIHPLSMHFVKGFAEKGYRIAVNEFEFTSRYMGLMDIIDFIKADVRNLDDRGMHNLVEVAHGMQKKCIATHIEDHSHYHMAKSMGADGFEGSYVTGRSRLQPRESSFLQTDLFRLLREVTQDVPNMDMAERIISEDPKLSYNLMKLVNSEFLGLRNHPSTVHQALSVLGAGQLKNWLFMLCLNPRQDAPDEGLEEFVQLSFMRARFYKELMRYADSVEFSLAEGYLAGMLSSLNQLIRVPMEKILEELSLREEFKRALVYKEGSSGKLLQLIISYELGDWNAMEGYAEELGIQTSDVTKVYFNCMEQIGTLWKKLNTGFRT